MNLDDLVTMAQEAFGKVAEQSLDRPRNPQSARAPVPDWLPPAATLPGATVRAADLARATVTDEPRGRGVLEIGPEDEIVVESSQSSPLKVPDGPPSDQVEAQGMDVLAYYLPFHFHARWGIYILASGIAYLAQRLKSARLTPADTGVVQSAFDVLYGHEHAHFICEAMAALGETAHLRPWYEPYFGDAGGASDEEALCNAEGMKVVRGRGTRGPRAHLAAWMSLQGDGYGRFRECLSAEGARKTTRAIVRRMRLPDPDDDEEKARRVLDILRISNAGQWPAEALWASVKSWRSRKHVPTYLVFNEPLPWLRVARPFPKLGGTMVKVYSNDHDPPHLHLFMPPTTEHGHGYRWPHLEPAHPKSLPLGRNRLRKVKAYLGRFGPDIHDRLQRVYGRPLPPLA